MELCKGFANWLECPKCPNLCTKKCPLEGENVIEKMKKQLNLLSGHGTVEKTKSNSK
jgi:hypothetical protein